MKTGKTALKWPRDHAVVAAAALVAGALLLYAIEPDVLRSTERERSPRTSGAVLPGSSHEPPREAVSAKERSKDELHAAALPPKFVGAILPPGFRRLDGARGHATDEDYARFLEEVRPWKGATPKHLGELPETGAMAKKRKEFGNDGELDYRLKLLARLDECVKRSRLTVSGSAVVNFWFSIDAKAGIATARRVSVEASTMPTGSDVALLECLHQAHAGGFSLKPEPGADEHVWPTTISIPVTDHEIYHWLFSED